MKMLDLYNNEDHDIPHETTIVRHIDDYVHKEKLKSVIINGGSQP